LRLGGGLAVTACTPLLSPLGNKPIGTPSPTSTLIGVSAAETVVITSDAHLTQRCTYTGGVEITASNVVSDRVAPTSLTSTAAMDAASFWVPTPKRRSNTSR
jgi:hypothetical protein